MEKVVRIKSTYTVEDDIWVETYAAIRELKSISESLSEEEVNELNRQVIRLREVSMEVLDTNNFVMLAEIGDNEKAIALVELDYLYTGENVMVTDFFKEDDEYYVTIETID